MSNMSKSFKAKGLAEARHYCAGTAMVNAPQEYAYGSDFVRDRRWSTRSMGNSRQGFQGGYGYQPDGVGAVAASPGSLPSRPQPRRPGLAAADPFSFDNGQSPFGQKPAFEPGNGSGSITFGGKTTDYGDPNVASKAAQDARVQEMKDQGFAQSEKNPQMFSRLTGNKYGSFEEGQKAIDLQVQNSLAAQQNGTTYTPPAAPNPTPYVAPKPAPTLAGDNANYTAPAGGGMNVAQFDEWRKAQDTSKEMAGIKQYNYGTSWADAHQLEGGAEEVEGPKGVDKVYAKLTEGESVLTEGASEALGRETIAALNAAHPPANVPKREKPQRTLHAAAGKTIVGQPQLYEEEPVQPQVAPTMGNELATVGTAAMPQAQNIANAVYEKSNPVQQALSQKLNAPTAPASPGMSPASNYLTEKVGAVTDPIRNAAGKVSQGLSSAMSHIPTPSFNPNGVAAQLASSVAEPARAVANAGKTAMDFGGKFAGKVGEWGQKGSVGVAKVLGPAMAAINTGRVINDVVEGNSGWTDVASQAGRDLTKLAGSTVAGTLAAGGTALTPAAPAAPAVGLAAGIGAHHYLDKAEKSLFGPSPVDKIVARNEANSPEAVAARYEAGSKAATEGAAKLGDIRDARDRAGEVNNMPAAPAGQSAIPHVPDPTKGVTGSVGASASGTGRGKGLGEGQGEYTDMVKNMYEQHQALLKQSIQGGSWADRENARVALKYLNPTLQQAMQSGASLEGNRLTANATFNNKTFEQQMKLKEMEEKHGVEQNKEMYKKYWGEDKEGKPYEDSVKNDQFRTRVHKALGEHAEDFYLLPKQTRDAWMEKFYRRNETLNRTNDAASGNYGARQNDDLMYGLGRQKGGTWLEETFGSNNMSGMGLWNQIRRVLPGDQSPVNIGGNIVPKDKVFNGGNGVNTAELEEFTQLQATLKELNRKRKGGK